MKKVPGAFEIYYLLVEIFERHLNIPKRTLTKVLAYFTITALV